MSQQTIKINRAPVLTLWGQVVAEHLGFDRDEALTLGKAVAGLNAQSKGQRLGIFQPAEGNPEGVREREPEEVFYIELMGRTVASVNTPDGIRATAKEKPIQPESVEHYLEGKFGEALPHVRQAMDELCRSFPPRELARKAFSLYEQFRPEIPEGVKGWGAAGDLDLKTIRSLSGPVQKKV
jgi:hypothetical protein